MTADEKPDPVTNEEAETADESDPGETMAFDGTVEAPKSFVGPGGVIADRYEIVKILGQGGMGAVYLAEDKVLKRRVALKVPKFSGDGAEKALDRFRREATVVASLQHPNICPIHDVGESDGVHFLSMAFVEGGSLDEVLRERVLPEEMATTLVRTIASAMQEAHDAGIVHRDLKPANVMIDKRKQPIVMDFGLAVVREMGEEDESRLTQQGTILGTPAYMPPEQVTGDLDAIGPASDIYSLGVILYELLSGKRPYNGSPTRVLGMILAGEPTKPTEINPAIDPRLEAITLRAMAKEPADRPSSMREFASELAMIQKGSAVPNETIETPVSASPSESFADFLEEKARERTEVERKPTGSAEGSSTTRRPPWVAILGAVAVLTVGSLWVRSGGEADVEESEIVERASGPTPNAHDGPNVPVQPKARPDTAEWPYSSDVAKQLQRSWADFLGEPVERVFDLGDGVTLTMMLAPPGRYRMGGEANGVDVEISEPFRVASTEVTRGQWARLMDSQPWTVYPDHVEGDDHALGFVSDLRAAEFCRLLSEKTGETFRLPTEAQWEWACRAGSGAHYSFGDDPAELDAHAWYSENNGGDLRPRRVALKKPNAWGLYDVHGNLWEMVRDYWTDALPGGRDPLTTTPNPHLVIRGACLLNNDLANRSEIRVYSLPDSRDRHRGFRVILEGFAKTSPDPPGGG